LVNHLYDPHSSQQHDHRSQHNVLLRDDQENHVRSRQCDQFDIVNIDDLLDEGGQNKCEQIHPVFPLISHNNFVIHCVFDENSVIRNMLHTQYAHANNMDTISI
jgi:hypothetical protein